MPDKNGQIARGDLIAPRGQLRIVKKNMKDGNISSVIIVGNFPDHDYAIMAIQCFREDNKASGRDDIFILCDDQGNEIYLGE